MPDSPNMNLPIPVTSVTPGPEWATLIVDCLNLIDAHDHTPGNGVPITPGAIDITDDLTMSGNSLTDVKSIEFTSQSVALVTIDTAYVLDGDLYFIDGDGNSVQITSDGGVAGTPGNIAGLVSPASATFISASGKFKWEQGTNIAADMDFASAIMRNSTPNSTFALTLKPPAALASNYSITLPALPASTKFLSMDLNGVISAVWAVDGSTLEIASGTIVQVKDLGISTAKLGSKVVTAAKIADSTITAAQIFSNTITGNEIAPNPNIPGNTLQENGKNVVVSNTNDASSLAIIRGSVAADGSILRGTGFSISHTLTGQYLVTFTTAFASTPSVVGSPNTASTATGVGYRDPSTTTVNMITYDSTTAAVTNGTFDFMVIGPRA